MKDCFGDETAMRPGDEVECPVCGSTCTAVAYSIPHLGGDCVGYLARCQGDGHDRCQVCGGWRVHDEADDEALAED